MSVRLYFNMFDVNNHLSAEPFYTSGAINQKGVFLQFQAD